jgi:hypothetical protein
VHDHTLPAAASRQGPGQGREGGLSEGCVRGRKRRGPGSRRAGIGCRRA